MMNIPWHALQAPGITDRLDASETKGLIAQDAIAPDSFNKELDELEKEFEEAVSPPGKVSKKKKKGLKKKKGKKKTSDREPDRLPKEDDLNPSIEFQGSENGSDGGMNTERVGNDPDQAFGQ